MAASMDSAKNQLTFSLRAALRGISQGGTETCRGCLETDACRIMSVNFVVIKRMVKSVLESIGWHRMRLLAIALLGFTFAGSEVNAAQTKPLSAASPICVEVVGQNQQELDQGLAFCATGVPRGVVTGLIVKDSLLFVIVTRGTADTIRTDRMQAERLVKSWMSGWRSITGKTSVTVQVELDDVEVAKGETTIAGGDQVTIRQ